MKKILLPLLVCASLTLNARTTRTLDHLTNQTLVLQGENELHLTGKNPLINATVNLQGEDAWLYFDNVRPSTVMNTYASSIRINNQPLTNNSNGRITIYKHGTVVIPHSAIFKPLTVYSGPQFTGESTDLGPGYQKDLSSFNNNIRSFRLKRGYMATFATEADGTGYSRVFVAQDEDIVFAIAPKELYGRTSFIRIIPWKYVSKKGWCTPHSDYEWEAGMTDATWFYTWSADKGSTSNMEYIPIKQHLYWPGWDQINNLQGTSAVLGYNEPDHSEQHDGTTYSAATASANMPQFQNCGLRIGSAAPTDKNWISSFATAADAATYRVDFVAMHAYWGGLSAATWYSTLKSWYDACGRPLWITEWNNGANWTTESWPSGSDAQFAKQLTDIKNILYVLDTCRFVERYSIYNWVEDKRAMLLGATLTSAGQYYRDNHPQLAYDPAVQVIPKTPVISTPTWTRSWDETTGLLTFTITDPNKEMTDRYVLQVNTDGVYKTVKVAPQRAYDLNSTTCSFTYKPDWNEKAGCTYRLKYEYLNGSVLYLSNLAFAANDAETALLNDFSDGDYYIINENSGGFLTNTGLSTPSFANRTGALNQTWKLFKDTTNRFKITSASSNAFLNESAQTGTAEYFPAWNTFSIYRLRNSELAAIQNGGKAGTYYWTISGNTITGKGSATQTGYPFRIVPAEGASILPQFLYKGVNKWKSTLINKGDSVQLTPLALKAGGSWNWSTGDTAAQLALNKLSTTTSLRVSYTLDGVSKSTSYLINVMDKNNLPDGHYCIINPADSTFLTNNGTLNPVFLPKDLVSPESQSWSVSLDPVSKRYSIVSDASGMRFLNEYGRFNTSVYSSAWNSFELINLTGSNRYAIQNGGSSGTNYWILSGNLITGKGSTSPDDFPFAFQPTQPALNVQAYMNDKQTDSLTVASGTSLTLQPRANLQGGKWLWEDGTVASTRIVNQTGVYIAKYILEDDTLQVRFKADFYQKATPADGAYLIRNPEDGTYLTWSGSGYPCFTGQTPENLTGQTWLINKDAASGRYKIVSSANNAVFLDEYGRYNGGTYYPAWNTYTLYNQTGTNRYAIQNGGSAGSAYWSIAGGSLRGRGSATLTGFPFELVDPAGEARVNGSAPAIRKNKGYLLIGDSILTEAGSRIVLRQFVGTAGGSFLWNTGAASDSLDLGAVNESGIYTVTYTLGNQQFTERFAISVYNKNPLPDGKYFLVNNATQKYLSYVHPSMKPGFVNHSLNIVENLVWNFVKDTVSGRYRITPYKNAAVFLDQNASFATTVYSADLNTYDLHQLTGTNKWAMRSSNTAGGSFWQPAVTSGISTTGLSEIVFPFEIREYIPDGLGPVQNEGPNWNITPVGNRLHIGTDRPCTLLVYSVEGRLLYEGSCSAGQQTITLPNLQAGCYTGLMRAENVSKPFRWIKTNNN